MYRGLSRGDFTSLTGAPDPNDAYAVFIMESFSFTGLFANPGLFNLLLVIDPSAVCFGRSTTA